MFFYTMSGKSLNFTNNVHDEWNDWKKVRTAHCSSSFGTLLDEFNCNLKPLSQGHND